MVAVAVDHDTGTKLLLDGFIEPAGLTAQGDITGAMHDIFMNVNVGPFISKQLIQKLVTGNPSPQYVLRVNSVFDNDGQGVRGNLKAVVSAILTDPEARGGLQAGAGYGKLREPVLFMTGLARAVNAKSDGVFFGQQRPTLAQDLFNPPSVFNYYTPTYVVPGFHASRAGIRLAELEHRHQSLQFRKYAGLRNHCAAGNVAGRHRHHARLDGVTGRGVGRQCVAGPA